MRVMRWLLSGMLVSLLAAPALYSQQTSSLEHGSLVVWVVTPSTAAEKQLRAAQRRAAALTVTLPTTVQQQTAGSFGQPSSNVGQTAGSYGQTAGSLGRAASDTGQTAGSYGKPPSELGTTSSNVGQTAGSYGQTAGSFGQPSSTLGQTAGSYGGALPVSATATGAASGMGVSLVQDLGAAFPALNTRFVGVQGDDLRDRLKDVAGDDYPDVVMMADLPAWWSAGRVGLVMLGSPVSLEKAGLPLSKGHFLKTSEESQPLLERESQQLVVMRRAPHPDAARAFVLWVRDEGLCGRCDGKELRAKAAQDAASAVAIGALQRVLGGAGLGSVADEDAAQFSATQAQRLALTHEPSSEFLVSLSPPDVQVDVLSQAANDRLAVVALRGIVSSPTAFGVVHALVVLRKDDHARWKVLHISPNMSPGRLLEATNELRPFLDKGTPAKIVGISQASPPDGDNRQRAPELWWDNDSGAGLLVVEWQSHAPVPLHTSLEWTDPRLMLLPDRDPRTKTRVVASFAQHGDYRWRVWAMGTGGALVISPWRSFHIVP